MPLGASYPEGGGPIVSTNAMGDGELGRSEIIESPRHRCAAGQHQITRVFAEN